MERTNDIARVIRRLHVPASAELDERVHAAIAKAGPTVPRERSEPEPGFWQLIRLLMKNKSTRYFIAAALGLGAIAAVILNHSTASAWALEQTIAALQKYKAVHIAGYTTAGGAPAATEFWARADATGARSDVCLAKSDNFTAWVRDHKTYIYDQAHNTVYVDSAVTIGVSPWFGPKLLTTLSKLPDYKAVEGEDPATGRKRILITASFEGSAGPQSFVIEFDATTKLPLSVKHWLNLTRQGAPDFVFEKITYFEDLPDGTFRFEPPAAAHFVERPLTIPEANLPVLTNPRSGISAEGLSREEACRKILEQLWAAFINNDFARIRQLCPLTATWPDGLLRDLTAEDDVVELLNVGGIEKEGQSTLGPLALVPSRVRCKDGKVREIKIIVQFRQTAQGASCVVNGNYGYSTVIE